MPITPFHFGPGAAFHSFAPKRISFLAFCAANVLVDVEPLYYMVTGQFPLHRFFHTYLGITAVIVATVLIFIGAQRLARYLPLPDIFGWQQLGFSSIAAGAALGGYSHIVLDSIMHADIRPLAPWSDVNGLYQLVPISALHAACLGAGVLGVVVLLSARLLAFWKGNKVQKS